MPNVTPLRSEDPDHIGPYRLGGRISGLPGGGPFYLTAGPDGTELAVRLLRGPWTRDAAARDRFAAEAAAARRVPPFCAARITDFGAAADYAYLVSEYVGGRSLLEVVAGRGRLRGPELEALALGSATGLAAVHQAGLVHGRFGPDYIVMNPGGPRIIEFGITPPYGPATPAADMLAWAQTMVFAAIGRPPATLADLDVLPGVLREIVAGCLAGDPGFRPEARSAVLGLLGSAAPDAGMLAEGSRRAARLTAASQRTAAERAARPPSRPARTPPGRRDGQPAGRGPAGPGRAQRPGRTRRRFPVVPVTIGVVVTAAVIAFLVVHLAGAGGRPAARRRPPVSRLNQPGLLHRQRRPVAHAEHPGGPGRRWRGQVQEPGGAGLILDVRLSLASGAAGLDTIAYSSAGTLVCSGELSPESVLPSGVVTLSQGIIVGQGKCGNGTVTLAGTGSDLAFSFSGAGAGTITSTLTRS